MANALLKGSSYILELSAVHSYHLAVECLEFLDGVPTNARLFELDFAIDFIQVGN